MSDSYVVAVEGLSALQSVEELDGNIVRAAYRAINTTSDRTRTAAGREMRRQVNFPARYLSGANGRLRIRKRASPSDLEGIIQGRHRPTSLARFSSGSVARGGRKGGVAVEVKPGQTKIMPKAFLLRLRVGSSAVDTRGNLGLAVRLKPGQRLANKRNMVRVKGNLYLLYGPSVDQVFRTVASDVAPEAAKRLEAEFLRLLDLEMAT